MEWIEECIRNWLDFKGAEFDSNNEVLFAMEEVGHRKRELKMLDKERLCVWMLEVIRNIPVSVLWECCQDMG